MKFARSQYRGRKTKWQFLNQFYTIQREDWKELRQVQKRLLVEGRMSVQAFKFEHNLAECPGWKWIQAKLAKANEKADPIKALNQINIYKLEMCVEEVEATLEKAKSFVAEQESLPLEATEGYSYNRTWNISVEERQALAEAE